MPTVNYFSVFSFASGSRDTPLVAPKMVNFAPKTKRNLHVWDSLPYPTEFFIPTTRVCTGGRVR